MENRQSEIKKANRRALPRFLIILAISCVVGFTAGFFSSQHGLSALSDSVKAAAAFFGRYVAPWLIIAMAVALPIVCVPIYRRAKSLLAGWDGENEGMSEAAEKRFSAVIWVSDTFLIVAWFLIAAVGSRFAGNMEALDEIGGAVSYLASFAAFAAILVEGILLQQKCIDGTKAINPEKKASIYDLRFQKKWMDSCDEAEKIMIGQCAYRAYAAVNMTCAILAGVLAVGAVITDIGFLPTLTVCVVWLISRMAYGRAAMRLSQSGVKIL